jgi:DNA-damage-inducible protein D
MEKWDKMEILVTTWVDSSGSLSSRSRQMSENLSIQLRYIVDALDRSKLVRPGGAEIWDARTIYAVMGYADWTNFRDVIQKAITTCENSGIFSANHFREFTDMIEVGKGAKRKIENWYLSRYACYLIAMNGSSEKPEIATAQSYFAAQTLQAEAQQALTDEERRFLLRDRVKVANKKLGGAAKDAGVRSRMFGVFQDAGYKGLYGGHGVREIKQKKGIETADDLLDCIGRAELAMHEFRITQTEEKLRVESIKGEQRAIDTHHAVGKTVRGAVKRIGGKMPEEYPAEPSIKRLLAAKKKLKASESKKML